jgi:hypothetical protein
MMKFVRILGACCLFTLAFVIGRSSGSAAARAVYAEQLQFVQTEKVWRSLVVFREVQTYLDKGCTDSAKKKVADEIEIGLMFIGEHVRAHPHGMLGALLETKEPDLLEEVRGQRVDWDRVFTVPACVPAERVSRGS